MRLARRAALALLALLALWALVIEPRRLVVHRETLALPRWPPALHGLRVAALADLHAGGWHMSAARLDQIVARTNAEHPDLVLLLGDFVSSATLGGRVEAETIGRSLAALHAPLGVFAVLGNHDWWFDGERVRRTLESAGIPVLDDRAIALARGGTRFFVAGIADYLTRDADPLRPLRRSAVPADAPLLFITHNPDVFPAVPPQAALTLAGHTHGGQLRLPLFGAPVVPSRFGQRYAAGHVVEGGRHLFVTTGLGTSILPLRLGVPPEIALLTLD